MCYKQSFFSPLEIQSKVNFVVPSITTMIRGRHSHDEKLDHGLTNFFKQVGILTDSNMDNFAAEGDHIVYDITISNTGNVRARDIQVSPSNYPQENIYLAVIHERSPSLPSL